MQPPSGGGQPAKGKDMIRDYIQSTEKYKGFTLEIRRFCLNEKNTYHRECRIYKNGKRIGISKTKKEAKDLISNGYI